MADRLRGQVGLLLAVHQPELLNKMFPFQRFSRMISGEGTSDRYLDMDATNKAFLRSSYDLYLPLIEAIEKASQDADKLGLPMKVGLAASGIFLEQMVRHSKDLELYDRLFKLVKAGRVEPAIVPYYHSLASTYPDKLEEFEYQLALTRALIQRAFGVNPQLLVNTHLLFSDSVMSSAERNKMGVVVADAPGARPGLYVSASSGVKVLVRDFDGSRALMEGSYESAYRPDMFPMLTINTSMLSGFNQERLRFMLTSLLSQGIGVTSPSELASADVSAGVITQPDADPSMEREVGGLDAFLGNPMQKAVYRRLMGIRPYLKEVGDKELLAHWRILQQTDVLASLSSNEIPGYSNAGYFLDQVEAYSAVDSIVNDVEGRVASAYLRLLQAKRGMQASQMGSR